MERYLQFELTNLQLQLIQVAGGFWNQSSIKYLIKQSINSGNEQLDSEKKHWIKILVDQVQKMKNTEDKTKKYAQLFIQMLGNRLVDWLKCVIKKLEGSENTYPTVTTYIDNLQWTSIGTIDEVKIFQSIYVGNAANYEIINMDHLFEDACRFSLKSIVEDIWHKYNEEEKLHLTHRIQLRMTNWTYINLTNYWQYMLIFHVPKNTGLIELYRVIDPGYHFSNNITMFSHSAIIGNDVSAIYFFTQLSTEEKNQVLLLTISRILEDKLSNFKNKKIINACDNHLYNKYINIFIYLWQNMTCEMRRNCFEIYKITILDIFFNEWPNKTLFFDSLNESWNLFYNEYDYINLIQNILHTIINEMDYFFQPEYHNIFVIKNPNIKYLHVVWNKTPNNIRKNIFNFFWKADNISPMKKLEQICLITSVINDKFDEIDEIRHDIIHLFSQLYYDFVIQNKYHILNLFYCKILKNDDDIEAFKKNINIKAAYGHLIVYKNFESAEKFLKWQFNDAIAINEFRMTTFKLSQEFLYTVCNMCSTTSQNNFIQNHKKLTVLFNWLKFTKTEIHNFKEKLINNGNNKIITRIASGQVRELMRFCDAFNPHIIQLK